ncbi:MAG: hypothetical protein JWM72_1753 [Actinomycetia bacterium]|nr:hypothetical protein [Actinomycetes bacterium]
MATNKRLVVAQPAEPRGADTAAPSRAVPAQQDAGATAPGAGTERPQDALAGYQPNVGGEVAGNPVTHRKRTETAAAPQQVV